jgi:hypothetical protein
MSELKRVRIVFEGLLPADKPKLANQIFVKADDECETLKAHLTELGVIDATFEMKVIKPKAESAAKADAPAVTEAAAPAVTEPTVAPEDEPAPAVEHIRSRGKHAA